MPAESLCWTLVAISVFAVAAISFSHARRAQSPINIPFKTFGGKQVWSDTHFYAGWRCQRHVWTGHYRLLDPSDIRRAWGNAAHCRDALHGYRKKLNLSQRSDHLVILLHGIGRSTGTFSKMVEPLEEAGYEVANLSYASTRRTIDEHAATLSELIGGLDGITRISFVTHSMGGIVLRRMLAEPMVWKDRIRIHRIVQIAPPNQGSMIARILKNRLWYRWSYGPAGQQLIPEYVKNLPAFDQEFGVIAGGRGDMTGLNPWLGADNDGTVTVPETRLPAASDTLGINAFHVSISNHPETIRAVLNFLRSGQFAEEPSQTETGQ